MVDSTPRELTARNLLLYWLPVLAWAGLIFYLSSMSEPPRPGVIGRLPFWTALGHWSEYFVFGALLYRAVHISGRGAGPALPVRQPERNNHSTACLVALAIGALYAASDEAHQYFVPGREMDVFDWIVDMAGLLIGSAVMLAWHRRRDKS